MEDVSNLNSVWNGLGTYYNSVSDSYQVLPANAPSDGNADYKPNNAGLIEKTIGTVGDAASSVGSGVKSVATSAYSGAKSFVASVEDEADAGISYVENKALKWVLVAAGILIVLVYVSGKSGAAGQITAAALGRP